MRKLKLNINAVPNLSCELTKNCNKKKGLKYERFNTRVEVAAISHLHKLGISFVVFFSGGETSGKTQD